ncbi:MAG: hypothetical protein K0R75_707 [Paenibacillaceae bacterium]|jgi:hypothetical protein|nr:hypothetical protein [Paenibacillaceae bacterium]
MVTKTVSYEESYFALAIMQAFLTSSMECRFTFISALSQKDRDRRIQIEFHVGQYSF